MPTPGGEEEQLRGAELAQRRSGLAFAVRASLVPVSYCVTL